MNTKTPTPPADNERELTIQPADRELLCQRCNQEYVVWFCPNELWNAVQREGEHFFCPTCFTVLAEQRGFKPTGWFVRMETQQDGADAHQIYILRTESAALRTEHENLKAELEAARKALEHYANKANWMIRDEGAGRNYYVGNEDDGCDVALEALARLSAKNAGDGGESA